MLDKPIRLETNSITRITKWDDPPSTEFTTAVSILDRGVSINWGYPCRHPCQIKVFHCKPSILGTPFLGNPHMNHAYPLWTLSSTTKHYYPLKTPHMIFCNPILTFQLLDGWETLRNKKLRTAPHWKGHMDIPLAPNCSLLTKGYGTPITWRIIPRIVSGPSVSGLSSNPRYFHVGSANPLGDADDPTTVGWLDHDPRWMVVSGKLPTKIRMRTVKTGNSRQNDSGKLHMMIPNFGESYGINSCPINDDIYHLVVSFPINGTMTIVVQFWWFYIIVISPLMASSHRWCCWLTRSFP